MAFYNSYTSDIVMRIFPDLIILQEAAIEDSMFVHVNISKLGNDASLEALKN